MTEGKIDLRKSLSKLQGNLLNNTFSIIKIKKKFLIEVNFIKRHKLKNLRKF